MVKQEMKVAMRENPYSYLALWQCGKIPTLAVLQFQRRDFPTLLQCPCQSKDFPTLLQYQVAIGILPHSYHITTYYH